jgi:hypothetical protein
MLVHNIGGKLNGKSYFIFIEYLNYLKIASKLLKKPLKISWAM